jgi:hypothetical protein
VCFLPACGGNSSSVAGNSPTPPASFATQADQVVADLAAGKLTAVEGRFDPAMLKAAQAAPLPKGWAACQDAMGAYRRHGAPAFARKGRFDLEHVPVTWAKGAGRGHRHFQPQWDHCRVAGVPGGWRYR